MTHAPPGKANALVTFSTEEEGKCGMVSEIHSDPNPPNREQLNHALQARKSSKRDMDTPPYWEWNKEMQVMPLESNTPSSALLFPSVGASGHGSCPVFLLHTGIVHPISAWQNLSVRDYGVYRSASLPISVRAHSYYSNEVMTSQKLRF